MNNSMIFRRIGAYVIDFMVVTFISMAMAYISFINPKYNDYMEVSDKYTELTEAYYNKDIEIEEYSASVRELSYEMNKTGYVYLIGDIVIAFLYYGVFQYFKKGQTFGKKIMNIKIVSKNDDEELKLYNYFIRTFILNGIIMNILLLVAICFSRSTYYQIYNIGSNFNSILTLVLFLSVMFSMSGRGLHDVLAGTKVVSARLMEDKNTDDAKVEVIKPKKGRKKQDD